jgi:hypothetical protein
MSTSKSGTIQIVPFPSGEAVEVPFQEGWTVEKAALEVGITDLKGMRLEINMQPVSKDTILKPQDMVCITGNVAFG